MYGIGSYHHPVYWKTAVWYRLRNTVFSRLREKIQSRYIVRTIDQGVFHGKPRDRARPR